MGVEQNLENVAEDAIQHLGRAAQENGSEVTNLNDAISTPKKEIASSEAVTIGEVDMDEEVLQEHAQAVVEELQKRGACTTLALARMLGMGKSTDLKPLLNLLEEKNVIVRVTNIPPMWSLSPDFPMSRLPSAADVIQVAKPGPALAPGNFCVPFESGTSGKTPLSPLPHRGHGSLPSIVGHPPSTQTDSRHAVETVKFSQGSTYRNTKPIITFPPIPTEPETVAVPVATSATPMISHALQQMSAEYWQGLNQNSNWNANTSGGN